MSLRNPDQAHREVLGLRLLDLPDVEVDEAHGEHVVGEERKLVLAVGAIGLERVPEELDVLLLLRALERERQVVAQFGGFFHGYRSETEAKQPAVFLGISQDRREHVVPKVETGDGLLERIVFIHRDDVLKAQLRGGFRADFQRAYQLPAINTVEEMAVVDQDSWPQTAAGTQTHQHHVEAENLHVLDALAAGALHRKLKYGPIGCFLHGHATGGLVQALRCLLKRENCLGQARPLFCKVTPQAQRQSVPFDLQLVLGALQLFGGLEALPQRLD